MKANARHDKQAVSMLEHVDDQVKTGSPMAYSAVRRAAEWYCNKSRHLASKAARLHKKAFKEDLQDKKHRLIIKALQEQNHGK